jgi:GH15 family glucan-1,4-alpha-glucosidase
MIEKRLIYRGLVMRNETAIGKADSRMTEGAFLPCSFWLADYYELVGRRKDADRLIHRLLKIRNDVGLLSEEYHADKRLLVGNFPQALSHVAMVNTILNRYSPYGPAMQRSGFTNHRKHFYKFSSRLLP